MKLCSIYLFIRIKLFPKFWEPLISFLYQYFIYCWLVYCCWLFVVVHSLSRVWLFVTLWTAAHQVLLSLTISQSLPQFMSMHQWYHPAISSSDAIFSFTIDLAIFLLVNIHIVSWLVAVQSLSHVWLFQVHGL